jgi:hypothetical protein
VHIRDAPPESLAFLASDFVHNARAALDNIVWALAPRQVQRRNPSFPLHEDPLRFQCEALPMLKGLKPGVIQAIEWCQPYHGGGHIRSAHRLLDLNRLWNFDKHRAPLVVGCEPDMAAQFLFYDAPDYPLLWVHMGHLLAEGKEVAWMPFHQSVPDDFNPHIHYSVAFLGAGARPIPFYGLTRAH